MDNNSLTIRQNTVDQALNAWNIFMVPRPPAPVFSNILKYAKKTQLGRQLRVVVLFCFIQPTSMQKPNLCIISFLPLTVWYVTEKLGWFSIYNTAMQTIRCVALQIYKTSQWQNLFLYLFWHF